MVDNREIQERLGHCYPYLLIDRIDYIETGKCAHGYKYFTENEWLFQCNKYENQPVPFTMMLEALIEMFVMPILTMEEKGVTIYEVSADDVYVYRSIYPGERLDIETSVNTWKRGIAAGVAKGYTKGELACSAQLKFVVPDVIEQFMPTMDRKLF